MPYIVKGSMSCLILDAGVFNATRTSFAYRQILCYPIVMPSRAVPLIVETAVLDSRE